MEQNHCDEEFFDIFRMYKTIWEMLTDRGYDINDSFLKMNMDDFKKNIKIYDNLIYQPKNGHNHLNKLCIFFCKEDNVGAKLIQQEFLPYVNENNCKQGIIILKKTITTQAKKNILENISDIRIELFTRDELLVNITKNFLVPRFFLIEDKNFLKQYNISESQLPRTNTNDPIIRYFGFKKGQLVKTINKLDNTINYRYVV